MGNEMSRYESTGNEMSNLKLLIIVIGVTLMVPVFVVIDFLKRLWEK